MFSSRKLSDQRYAFHGECFFKYGRNHMIRNDFPYIPLGKAGGIDGWSLTMRRRFVHGEPVFRPMIHTFLTKPILKCRFYIRIWKNNELAKDPKENYIVLEAGNGPMTDKLIISEWMDEDYWTNGGILVDYGLQIEGFLSSDNIWTFNFHDKMFDCQEKKNMISFYKENDAFHCHKQLLTFHSTYFNSDSKENQMIELTDENPIQFEAFLQISHGVRNNYEKLTLEYAHKYKMFNVIQLLDHTWRQMDLPISSAIHLNHCLAELLGKIESLEELVQELKKVDLEEISGEMMKKFVMVFMEF